MLALWHWHIEISSKCTLRCPRCARQEVPDSLINTELDLEFFKKNFTPEFVDQHVRKITFCGDDGDPIYAHDLIAVIQYLKSIRDVEIVIVTNGSYKSVGWWESLGRQLTNNDSVHFSIDGYDQASNEKYRVNSDWSSIQDGIWALRQHTGAKLVWAAIAFDFNQDHFDKIEALARSQRFDFLQITRSTKFAQVYPIYGPTDALQPRSEWIANNQRFDRRILQLGSRSWGKPRIENIRAFTQAKGVFHNKNTMPLCAIGNKGVYINSQGHLFPCCWVANRYAHNAEWQERGRYFDLTQRMLNDVLNDVFWTDEFQKFNWYECKTKCASQVVTQDYATQW